MAYFVNNKRSSYVSGLELIFPELNKLWYKALLLSRTSDLTQISNNIKYHLEFKSDSSEKSDKPDVIS